LGLCLHKKMWLSLLSVCSAVVNNGIDSSWRLYVGPLWPTKYWRNTTSCLQRKPNCTVHKWGATELETT